MNVVEPPFSTELALERSNPLLKGEEDEWAMEIRRLKRHNEITQALRGGKKKYKKFPDCYDWHMVERQCISLLMDENRNLQRKQRDLDDARQDRVDYRRKLMDKLAFLMFQYKDLMTKNSEKSQKYDFHKVVRKHLEAEKNHTYCHWKNLIDASMKTLEELKFKLNKCHILKQKLEIQQQNDVVQLEAFYCSKILTKEQREEYDRLIYQLKSKVSLNEARNQKFLSKLGKKRKQLRAIKKEIALHAEECEALRSTLKFYRRLNPLLPSLAVIEKRVRLKMEQRSNATSTDEKENFRPRYKDELISDYIFFSQQHEKAKNYVFRKKKESESLATYLQEKSEFFQGLYLFRPQRKAESDDKYLSSKSNYYAQLFKLPYKDDPSLTKEENYRQRRKYKETVLEAFRPQYHDEADDVYEMKKTNHYRRLRWADFRKRHDNEDIEGYYNQKLEYYKSFLVFRDQYIFETEDNYNMLKKKYENRLKQFSKDVIQPFLELLMKNSRKKRSSQKSKQQQNPDQSMESWKANHLPPIQQHFQQMIIQQSNSDSSLKKLDAQVGNHLSKELSRLQKWKVFTTNPDNAMEILNQGPKLKHFTSKENIDTPNFNHAPKHGIELSNIQKSQTTFGRYVDKHKLKLSGKRRLKGYLSILLGVIKKRANSQHNVTKSSERSHIRELFRMLDVDNDGSISHLEIQRCLHLLGLPLPSEDILEMIQEVDKDNNGEIDYKEFLHIFKSRKKKAKSGPFWK